MNVTVKNSLMKKDRFFTTVGQQFFFLQNMRCKLQNFQNCFSNPCPITFLNDPSRNVFAELKNYTCFKERKKLTAR